MGNENEISASKGKFLPRQVLDQDPRADGYSINEEFSKTKKNRSFFFYFVAAGFLGLLLFLTYALTAFIHKSYEAGVGAGLIKNIQLKDLFVESQGIYDKLKLSVQNIESLKNERDEKSARLRQAYEKDIENLKQQKLPRKKYNAEQRKKTRLFKKELQALRKKYNERIREKHREAKRLERKAKQNERLLERKAAQIKEIANNYGQLQELKLAQQLLKFNPIIKEKTLKQILKEKNEFSLKDSLTFLPYPGSLGGAVKIEEEPFEKRLSDIKKRNALMQRLLKVPYTNSVPSLLARLDSLNKSINQSYEKLWQSFYRQLRIKQGKLDLFRYALGAYYTQRLKEETKAFGYILDARHLQNIYLYISKDADLGESAAALVLRGEDDKIAKVKLFRIGSEYRAQLVEMLDSDGIQPFDRLVPAKFKIKEE